MSVQSVSTGRVTISTGSGALDSTSRGQIQSLLGVNVFSNDSTILGQDAAPDNKGKFNTFIGREAGLLSVLGMSNLFIGYRAGESAEGANNMLIGNNAGAMNGINTGNMFIGNGTGESVFSVATNRNTVLGHFSAAELGGIENVLIGYSNSTVEQAEDLGVSNVTNVGAVGIGANTFCATDRGVSVGFGCTMLADFAVAAGASNTVTPSGARSVVLGSHIRNSGECAVIVRACDMDQADDSPVPVPYSNAMDHFLNIHDRLVGRHVTHGPFDEGAVYEVLLRGEQVALVASSNTSTADMTFEDTGALSFVRVYADGLDLGGQEFVYVRSPATYVEGDLVVSGEVRMSGEFTMEGTTRTDIARLSLVEFADAGDVVHWQQGLVPSSAEGADAGRFALRNAAPRSGAFLEVLDEGRRSVHAA